MLKVTELPFKKEQTVYAFLFKDCVARCVHDHDNPELLHLDWHIRHSENDTMKERLDLCKERFNVKKNNCIDITTILYDRLWNTQKVLNKLITQLKEHNQK